MTLGAWIFLSVVLVLVVFNKPFRKFFLWAAAASAVCCGLFFGYVWVRDWQENRAMAREAADAMKNAFERLANADLYRANPDITVQEAIASQHPTLDFSKAQPIAGEGQDQRTPGFIPDSAGSHLPPGYTLEHPAR